MSHLSMSAHSTKSGRVSDDEEMSLSESEDELGKEKRVAAVDVQEADDDDDDDDAALLAEEYDPARKRRRFEHYVPPRMYDPYSRLTSGVGWKYEPEDLFGRWDSSYLPPHTSHLARGETSALKEQLSIDAAITDVPLDIHTYLQQLRTDLLGDAAAGPDLRANAEDSGRVVDVSVLDKAQLSLTGYTPGDGPTSYFMTKTSAKPARRAPACSGTDSQLTARIPPRVQEMPGRMPSGPMMTSLAERLAKLREMR